MEATRKEGRPVAAAERQLGRAVMGAVLLASILALGGPAFSLQSDLGILRALLQDRVQNDARLDASALERRLSVVTAELERLSRRAAALAPNKDPDPRRLLLQFAHDESALFDSGLVILGPDGLVVAAQPEQGAAALQDVMGGSINQMQTTRLVVAPLKSPLDFALAVAVPVRVDGAVVGAVVGAFDVRHAFPAPLNNGRQVFLMDSHGTPIIPLDPPPAVKAMAARVVGVSADGNGVHVVEDDSALYAGAPVRVGGLHVVLSADEEVLFGPMKMRALVQMALLVLFQGAAVLLLAAFLRLSYQRFLTLERRITEEARLASLGAASSLIAHEVKNSLNGLQAACSVLPRSPEAAGPVKVIRGQVDRLQYLARSLLSFGKPNSAHVQPTDVSALINETLEGVALIPEADDVTLHSNVPDGVTLDTDPLLLATALHNLVRNAVEAAASAKDVGRQPTPQVTVTLSQDDAAVHLQVDDNAGGVPPEVLGRLFEPFVTSKPKGIGLGLSVSRQAVEAQGGALLHESLDGGSRFTVVLPRRHP